MDFDKDVRKSRLAAAKLKNRPSLALLKFLAGR
jgi:hypothetical protein